MVAAAGGGGGGDVSASGTPVNNQLAIWTDANTIEGSADLTFDGSTIIADADIRILDGEKLLIGTDSNFQFYGNAGSSKYITTLSEQLLILNQDASGGPIKIQATDVTNGIQFNIAGTEMGRFTSTGLGIGTTLPSHPLSVYGSLNDWVTELHQTNTTAGQSWGLQVLGGTNSSDMTFEAANAAGTAYFNIRGDGNVGIGTTSPAYTLDVSSGYINSARLYLNEANNYIMGESDNMYIRAHNDMYFNIDTPGDSILRHFIWRTNTSSELMRLGEDGILEVKSGGKVGIGTAAPTMKLEVASSDGFAGYFRGTSTATIASDTTNNNYLRIKNASIVDATTALLGYQTGNGYIGGIVGIEQYDADDANNVYANLVFGTKEAADSTPNRRMTILHDGKVGIGTATPLNSGKVTILDGSNPQLVLANDGTEYFTLEADGNYLNITAKSTDKAIVSFRDNGNTYFNGDNIIFEQVAEKYFQFKGTNRLDFGSEPAWQINDQSDTLTFTRNDGTGDINVTAGDLILNGDSTAFSIKDADGTETVRLATASGDEGLLYLRGPTGGNSIYLDGNSDSYINNGANFGIGTTAPSMALHVNSSSYDVAEFSSSHAAGAKLILDADATGGTEFALQSTADGAGTGGGKLDFVNAGNSRMVLTAAGNLGIGITTPASSLHINGTGDQKIILKSASANSEGLVIASAAGSERVDFSTDGANVMCFTAADKVGIGTTSPNSKMTVQGDLDVPVNSRFRAGSGDSNHTGVDIYHDGSNNYTLIENRPSGGDLIFRQMHNGKDYIFKADNDSGTEQEVMRIDGSNARVGIGTAAPDVALDVRDAGWPIAALHGTSEYGTGIQLYNTHTTDQAWAIIGGGTSQSNYPLKFYDQTNAVYRMVLDNTGKLGIGTTEPTEVLDVRSANNTLALFKSSDNRGLIQVADDDTTASIVAENSTLSLGLTSSISASNLNIDSAGNVGIGTTTPDYTLELENTAPQLGFNDTNGRKFYLMSQSDKFWLGDATGGTTPLVVDSAGNVGIGTSSPSNPLHIAGHVNPLRLQGTSTGKVELGVSTSGDFTIDADDDIRLDSGGQDIVLYGQGSQFARLTNASTDFEILTTTQDRDLIFKGNDGGSTIEAMRIDYSAGGFVGIGTTAPAYKLDVFGDARVKGTASHLVMQELKEQLATKH